MTIEARLDMHGYTQAQAHQALNSFLLKCHSLGMRCVLIITGKGLKSLDNLAAPARGVLNRNLPIWIKEAPLKEIVLKASPAAIKDGGAGAYYVYLKRKRNY
jgi:DNA-nicking Smr family endonuclease